MGAPVLLGGYSVDWATIVIKKTTAKDGSVLKNNNELVGGWWVNDS